MEVTALGACYVLYIVHQKFGEPQLQLDLGMSMAKAMAYYAPAQD